MNRVLTLLVTDIVDSTKLNDELGDARMASLWRAHDRAARELMLVWHGQEIGRSDGFLVLFEGVADAVGFAAAYHQALASIDARLKARVGLHVGPVALRENSLDDKLRGAPSVEVDGVALPIVSRVMAAAQGGQTLLTAPAAHALGADARAVLRSHGHWRLKGISEPLELFQVGDPDSLFEPPPDSVKSYRVFSKGDEWAPVRTIANNLPAERDAFIGRKESLQTLASLLDGPARLVTVLGIGGVGKTRLVARHAHTWLGDYPGGAWFCDLSTARGLDGIAYAVAQALDVPLGKSDPVRQIGSAIAARGPCLVILDTFEQVARDAASTLGIWLEVAPDAKFVVTSREVLGIPGEHALVLAPMTEPEACDLFLRRVAAAAQRELLTPRDRDAIGPLVRLLDGLPLAIELAAARSRVMSPRMLLDRMHERFTLLTTRGGRLDRQITLRATLDWSWDMLLPEEKSALAQLSVFEGGFTLESAEAVLAPVPGRPHTLPMDLVQSLLDKSFVRKIAADRFDLLQSVQEYGAEHLRSEGRFEGSGPAAALQAEVRHSVYFGGLSDVEVTGPGSVELDNVSIACRRAAQRGDCASATRTLALAWSALELRGPFRLGLDLATLVSSVPGLPMSSWVEVLLIKGRALRALGKMSEAGESFAAALSAARNVDSRRGEAEALSKLGSLKTNAGKLEEARIHLKAGLALAREVRDGPLECELLNALGSLYDAMGQIDPALIEYERALSIARRLANRRWEGGVLGNLGNVYYSEGRLEDARTAYEAALVIAGDLGNRQWEANTLCNLGLLHHVQGNSAIGMQMLQTSLRIARDIGHSRLEAFALCNLGLVESTTGNPEEAQRYLEAGLNIAERLSDPRLLGQMLGYLGVLRSRQGATTEGLRHLQRGQILLEATEDDPNLAILHCNGVEAFAIAGDSEAAHIRLEMAQEVAGRLGEKLAFDVDLALKQAKLRLRSLSRPSATSAGTS